MCYIKIEIHGRGFDCIWQVIFKLSRVAEAQFNTRMNEIPQLLDVFLYKHFSAQDIMKLRQNLSAE